MKKYIAIFLLLPALNKAYSQVDTVDLVLGGATVSDTTLLNTFYVNKVTPTFTPAFKKGAVLFMGSFGNVGQDSSRLFYDSSSNRLLIGTGTASERLVVSGNIKVLGSNQFLKFGAGTNVATILNIDNFDISGTTTSEIRVFRNTNTTGAIALEIFKADNSTTIQHNFSANNNSYVNNAAGNFGVGVTSPGAKLTIAAGTASIAPLGFTSGPVTTTPVAGRMEYDGTNYFVTTGTVRYILTRTLTGTAAPATTPAAVGIQFVDTTNKKVYVSTGTASSADWTILN